ncbi:MAG: glycosyltransferase 87 family protein [Nitrososphaerales archaeon]
MNKIVFAAMFCLIALNLFTFARAYPEISTLDSGCCSNQVLAKDFSAYYVGAWRLFHDTSNVYTPCNVSDGGPSILPRPESFKYLPSFLLIVSPFLLLSYKNAIVVFDGLQLLLLPLMAVMTYRLVRSKGVAVTLIVATVVLLQPSPAPNSGLSVSYYWQWAEGQSKVLETFLLLLSFYLGDAGKPRLSGVALGMAAFDPRFALMSVPLFFAYNRQRLRVAASSAVGFALASNFAFLFPGVGSGFMTMLLNSGLTTPPYYYSFIPLLTVVCLTILNAKEIKSLVPGRASSHGGRGELQSVQGTSDAVPTFMRRKPS